ncbi:MAG: InlB B-repeat-containing protein [Lachnospiraceae bacterium]|nr:InlB B-repeat-containing protein [Lachnospiraceae bacterium]
MKRRKRGFWALCLAAMLSLMPGMQTMAADAVLGTNLASSNTSQEMPGPSLSNIGVNDTLTWSLDASGNSRVYYSEDPATVLNSSDVYGGYHVNSYYPLSGIYAGYEDLDADAISGWNATSLWTNIMGTDPYDELHITLTPVYKDYALTYQLDEGTNGANPASYTFITPDFALADASKAHYTFGGWFKEATFTTAVTSIPKHSKGNMTLYAKFTPETYAITYELDGGTNAAANPANYTYATGVASFADPVKEGYTFGGWFLDAAFTTAVTSLTATDFGAKTLYAKWTAIPPTNYTVTFDANGHGTAPAAQTVASGSKVAEPAALTADGFTFGGWYKEAACENAYDFDTAVTADITLYAKWTENPAVTYTVTFDANGHGTAPAPQSVASGAKAAEPAALTAEGYTFGGWYKEAACENAYDFGTAVTADITLYAKWTENAAVTYTVTFDANGHGTAPAPQSVASGAKATEPAALTAEGYTFGGWYKEADCKNAYDFGTAVTADITLYAKWTENAPSTQVVYWVAFHANGHGVAPDAQNVPEGGKAVTPIPPTAEGYTFGGWYIDAPCTVAYNFDDPVTMNMTLYAKWTANGPSVPKTGDDLPDVGLWVSLLGVGLSAVTAAVIRLRRCK